MFPEQAHYNTYEEYRMRSRFTSDNASAPSSHRPGSKGISLSVVLADCTTTRGLQFVCVGVCVCCRIFGIRPRFLLTHSRQVSLLLIEHSFSIYTAAGN